MKNIYLSSIALFGSHKFEEIINFSKKNKINIEFSSGLEYNENASELLEASNLDCYIHNYFPAPADPFVINLASTDNIIREKSINHCINGLNLSKKIGAKFFSAHAGFCIDPDPLQLGSKWDLNKNFNKELHNDLFIDSLNRILKVANSLSIKFLIENNVLLKANYIDQKNPLFAVNSDEILEIFNQIKNHGLGLLFDTGHFKVSCTTLSLDLDIEYNKISHIIDAIHHSDNNGKNDTNSVLGTDYWFNRYYSSTKYLIHILEVKKLNKEQILQQLTFLNNGFK